MNDLKSNFLKIKKAITMIELVIVMMVLGMIIPITFSMFESKKELQEKIKLEQQLVIEKEKINIEQQKIVEKLKPVVVEQVVKPMVVESKPIVLKETYENKDNFKDNNSLKTETKNKQNDKEVVSVFTFSIIFVIVLLLFSTFFGKMLSFVGYLFKERKEKILSQELEKENEILNKKFDLSKYKDANGLINSYNDLNELNEIDKNLIKDIFKIVKNENTINFLKEQLKDLYNNTYKIIKEKDDLKYVVEQYKKNNKLNVILSKDEDDLYYSNNNKIDQLALAFYKNKATYNYILLQLPKLNNENNLNDINNEIKDMILNITNLNNHNKDIENMAKKYS